VLAVRLWYAMTQQRRAARSLELRLSGVRGEVKELTKTKLDTEAGVHHLVRTDPEDVMAAMQQRLMDSEHFARLQQSRNEATDLESRVDYIRAQQQALKERLAPVLERRREIEQLFIELDGRQNDLDRTLQEIASGDDAVAIDIGIKKMMEAVRRSHERCDDIERSAKIMANLTQDFAELSKRLAPYGDAEDGIAGRFKVLREARDRLTVDIDSLLVTREGTLAERVQKFADDKKTMDGRLSEMNDEFAKLATLRRDLAALFARFNSALDLLAMAARGNGAGGVDARVEELAEFISATQAHVHDIERRLATFRQLKAKLGNLQSQLVPLEAEDSGVISVIEQLREVRDRLVLKIRRMEESDDGSLADRVKKFTENRRELEERVALLNDQFVKLAAIREDIAGLFQKLSSAVSASAD
jgi:DNA repair exonuclease SbcCD ATPase subunit